MTLTDLKEQPRIAEFWARIWPDLEKFLSERLLARALSPAEPAATRELATLIKDLRTVALPETPDQIEAPRMKPLNSMSEPQP